MPCPGSLLGRLCCGRCLSPVGRARDGLRVFRAVKWVGLGGCGPALCQRWRWLGKLGDVVNSSVPGTGGAVTLPRPFRTRRFLGKTLSY